MSDGVARLVVQEISEALQLRDRAQVGKPNRTAELVEPFEGHRALLDVHAVGNRSEIDRILLDDRVLGGGSELEYFADDLVALLVSVAEDVELVSEQCQVLQFSRLASVTQRSRIPICQLGKTSTNRPISSKTWR